MPSLDATPVIIVTSLVIGQSLFFGAYIVAARRHNAANVFLAGFMIAFALVQSGKFFLEFSPWPGIKIYTLPLDALLAPLMYLYTVRLTSISPEAFSRRQLWHLSSFAIASLLILPWALLAPEFKNLPITLDFGVVGVFGGYLWPGPTGQTGYTLQTAPLHLLVAAICALWLIGLYQVQMTAYVAALVLVFWRHRERIRQNFSDIESVKLRWLGFLCIACLAMWLSVVPVNIVSAALPIGDKGELVQEIIHLLIIVGLGFQGMRQPVIYTADVSWAKLPHGPAPRAAEISAPLRPPSAAEPAKYARSGLSKEQMERIAGKLMRAMRAERHYLDSSLTLPQLAGRTMVSVNHISQVLNVHLGMNFFDFVNGFRIEAAKDHLLATDMTILDVAFTSGFNSKSTFNAAFKKSVGETPGRFRAQGTSSGMTGSEA